MNTRPLLLLVLLACGGSRVDLGVGGGKKLAELDRADSCELLEGVGEFTDDLLARSCVLTAQAQANGQGDFEGVCNAALSECTAQLEPTFGDIECATVENNIPASCEATVRDLERCLSDILAVFDDLTSAGCDRQLDLQELEELAAANTGPQPESCEAVSATCPGFL